MGGRPDTKTKLKFSSFFKSVVIELDKDIYGPDNHLIEVPALYSIYTYCSTVQHKILVGENFCEFGKMKWHLPIFYPAKFQVTIC